MVFPGDQQPPSDPFASAPPGQYGPGPINPAPFPPARPPGSSAWKYILIGCLAIILLGGIVTAGSCAYIVSKGGDLMKFIKSEYVKNLTPDHTPEQRAYFEQAYDLYAGDFDRMHLIEWAEKYDKAIDQLAAIDADGQITVEESQAWADMVLNGGSGETSGEPAPAPTGGDVGNGASDQPDQENSNP